MNNIKDRILELAKKEERFLQDFFAKTGLKYSNYTGVNKQSDVGSKSLAVVLHHYPNTDLNWLITGETSAQNSFEKKYYELLEENRVLSSKIIELI